MLIAAVVVSVVTIVLLWRGDPKRRRVAGLPDKGQAAGLRRLLCAVALAPGIGLASLGDDAAFFVWLGACAIGGWLVAQTQPVSASNRHRRRG